MLKPLTKPDKGCDPGGAIPPSRHEAKRNKSDGRRTWFLRIVVDTGAVQLLSSTSKPVTIFVYTSRAWIRLPSREPGMTTAVHWRHQTIHHAMDTILGKQPDGAKLYVTLRLQ